MFEIKLICIYQNAIKKDFILWRKVDQIQKLNFGDFPNSFQLFREIPLKIQIEINVNANSVNFSITCFESASLFQKRYLGVHDDLLLP